MAIPPSNELRLQHEKESGSLEDRMRALCEAYARNFEDLYNRFQPQEQNAESLALLLKTVTGKNHKVSFGEANLNWLASKNSAKVEVEHKLGARPFVLLQIEDPAAPFVGGVSLDANLVGRTTTKFTMAGTCSEAITATFACCWLAIV